MPICKHCNKLIKPLGMPVDLVEQMEKFLVKIIDDVNYEMSDNYYRHPAHYPVPAVRLVVEYCLNMYWDKNRPSIIVWREPCVLLKEWTYHDADIL